MIRDFNKADDGSIIVNVDLSIEAIARLQKGETIPMGYKEPDNNIDIRIRVRSGKTDAEIHKEVFGREMPVIEDAPPPIIEESARLKDFGDKLQNSEEEMRIKIKEFLEKLKKDEKLKNLFWDTLTNMMSEAVTYKLYKFFRVVK